MSRPSGFTLLEVLLSAALFALAAAACVPMLTWADSARAVKPDPALAAIARAPQPVLPPNAEVTRFGSNVGESITGEWVVVQTGGRMAAVWIPVKTHGTKVGP